MIIPSIDLQSGRTVQLVGGKQLALDGGDPRPWLERFSRVGEVAVIDLDAATGSGSNRDLIQELCARQAVRIGGGIRDYATAVRWLDAGAARIILGTAAEPPLLKRLPRDRICVALDANDGVVVVNGWQTSTGSPLLERVAELREYTDSFLVTFVEREGRQAGTDMALARSVVDAAGPARVTIAGGISTPEEISELDRIGADAQVGMAIYTGAMPLGNAFTAPLRSDRPDGLWPTVVVDEAGRALGLAYSDQQSIDHALENGCGTYHSRKRGLWTKGATSGQTQELVRIEADCDRDALRFVVRQAGAGFCHLGSRSCWGKASGLDALQRTLLERKRQPLPGSYSARLLTEPAFLASKLREETEELIEAQTAEEVRHEAADVLYFTLARIAAAGVSIEEVEAELDARALRVTRRPPKADAPLEVADILTRVREEGERGVRDLAETFGDLEPGAPMMVERQDLERALEALDPESRAVLERTACRIREFAEAQRGCIVPLDTKVTGGRAGHDLVPIERVGCYAPGGRYPLPSSVLMTVIPARVAGVADITVASPRPEPITLAAAALAGADRVLAVGGAQAIGALAYGAGVPAVDFLCGPGNRWVTEAKRQVFGTTGVDMLAGPSELLVVADSAANPQWIAADLIAQAEHDPDAKPALVCTDANLLEAVLAQVESQLSGLPTAEVARAALAKAELSVVENLDEALTFANRYAPEHLALHVSNPDECADQILHAGALFVGGSSAEAFGDYGIGPNHALPTGRGARYRGGLAVFDFLRVRTHMKLDSSEQVAEDIAAFARLERLEAHARSAEIRTLPAR